VTDRAQRYRANKIADAGELGPKVCHFCGDPKAPVMVGHIDGHEENSEPENLAWTCRPCNSLTANVLNRAGMGRLTHQFNPRKKRTGITFGQYTTAVQVLRGESDAMPVNEAVEIVRAVPAYRRSSFAKDVWRLRKERYGPSGRRNPADLASEAFERFHGYPAEEKMVFESVEHEHTVFADIGELMELVIVPEGEKKGVKLFGFDGARLTMNEDWSKPQVFVIGGDQAVDLNEFGIDPKRVHEREILGKVVDVLYYTAKTHLGKDGGEADYHHKFGEESAKRHFRIEVSPTAAYDTVNQTISLWGGRYTIEEEGIRD